MLTAWSITKTFVGPDSSAQFLLVTTSWTLWQYLRSFMGCCCTSDFTPRTSPDWRKPHKFESRGRGTIFPYLFGLHTEV
jgi:hypothetical protein